MQTAATNPGFNPGHLDEVAVTQALASGSHAPVLQAYFGSPAFEELTALAKQALATPPDRHAPLIYLLPGLLGSKLGIQSKQASEMLWLDPLALVSGRLPQLAIGKRRSIRAQGVMLPGYLKLILSLQAAGFRVRAHAYDWRRSVLESGKQLAEELLHEAGEVMVVAHSMGGLLARVALKQVGSAKVTRVIQLGTPNQGSFSLVQVLRSCYPTVRKLGAVDQLNSAEVLTQQVFRSYFSFYEMLPGRAQTSGIDLFDPKQWPQQALMPLLMPMASRLKLGRRLPRHLAAADRRCHVIAGVDQPTVCGVRSERDEFIFQYRQAGDGTVPLTSASWAGARHWFVAEAHGQLPRNTQVCQATIDLLRGETTRVLADHHEPGSAAITEHSESALRAVLNGKVRWDQLPMSERRDLIEPVISPLFSSLCMQSNS